MNVTVNAHAFNYYFTVYMIWGIVSTIFLFLGSIAALIYFNCIQKRLTHADLYTELPSSASPTCTFAMMTPSPTPIPPPHRSPPRLPHVVIEDEEESYEPIAKRTRSSTRKKLLYDEEEDL